MSLRERREKENTISNARFTFKERNPFSFVRSLVYDHDVKLENVSTKNGETKIELRCEVKVKI